MTKKDIDSIYKTICSYHKKYLKKLGVSLPSLKNSNGKYTKDALVLTYLAKGYPKTKKVTKRELTQFIRTYYPKVTDVQQARHLGAQKGWWILAGGRDNIVLNLKRGEYQLYNLKESYPEFKQNKRSEKIGDNWNSIKIRYSNKCATCGSEENQPHLHWPSTKTILQKAHMDPNKPLQVGNIIPQCQKCNRGDRNRWVYDEKGRVIKIADSSVIKSCSEKVKRNVYRILYKKYKGKKPRSFQFSKGGKL